MDSITEVLPEAPYPVTELPVLTPKPMSEKRAAALKALPLHGFKKGNKFGQGRPPNNKAQIVAIRSRILRVVKRRVMREKDLDTVSTSELLKFLASIMPKDSALTPATQINYISNVPRETQPEAALPLVVESITDTSATNSGTPTIEASPVISQAEENSDAAAS